MEATIAYMFVKTLHMAFHHGLSADVDVMPGFILMAVCICNT